jgi:hypothetical protein
MRAELEPGPSEYLIAGRNRFTALPTDATVPANSIPSMVGFPGLKTLKTHLKGCAFLTLQSAAQTVLA